MSKYIKENMLSVGYNNAGQEFFDILGMFGNYINSYYFSLTEAIDGSLLDGDTILDGIANSDRYGIKGNLLFNRLYSDDISKYIEMIDHVRDNIDISSITILVPDIAEELKKKYPDLEIHLSVRYYDWNMNKSTSELTDDIMKYRGIIDVINVSSSRSMNDFKLMERIKNNGFRNKIIINEGCFLNQSFGYREFPEFKEGRYGICTRECNGSNKVCTGTCGLLVNDHPWIKFCIDRMHKEFFKYYDGLVDIYKLSSRWSQSFYLLELISYYLSDERTKKFRFISPRMKITTENLILNDEMYQIFLECLEMKSKCSLECYKCRKCKEYYDRMADIFHSEKQ